MFKVGKEFHLLHMVSDLDTVDGWYDEVFAVRRFVRNSMKAAIHKASLVLIGDFVMEPAQPLRPARGAGRSRLSASSTRATDSTFARSPGMSMTSPKPAPG
jgi:hypothetical protein